MRIGHRKEMQRPTTRALAPPQMFPVNPQKKHKNLHIWLGKIVHETNCKNRTYTRQHLYELFRSNLKRNINNCIFN